MSVFKPNTCRDYLKTRLSVERLENRKLLAGVVVSETLGRTLLNDYAGADSYFLSLDAKPSSNVTVQINATGPVEARNASDYLPQAIFTPFNWDIPQKIDVIGTDFNYKILPPSSNAFGTTKAVIDHRIQSDALEYSSVLVRDVEAKVIDTNVRPYAYHYELTMVEGETRGIDAVSYVFPQYSEGGYTGPYFIRNYDVTQFRINNEVSSSVTFEAINDGPGEGTHVERVTFEEIDGYPNPKNIALDDILVEIHDHKAPQLSRVVVNEGETQRSILTSIRLDFDTNIYFNLNAFQLINTTTGATIPLQANFALGLGSSIELTFADGNGVISRGGFGNSLMDGRYRLEIAPNGIGQSVSGLEMASGIVYGNSTSHRLFRLFGDLNGDAQVEASEVKAAVRALGSNSLSSQYNPALDELGDGVIDVRDLTRLVRNLGRRI